MSTLVRIKERHRLTKPESDKETYHLVLDLSGTGIRYCVGDCLGIHPSNPQERVDEVLAHLGASGTEEIADRKGERHQLRTFLSQEVQLERVSKKLLTLAGVDAALDLADYLAKGGASLLTPATLAPHLPPLLPRLYSIASSMKEVGEEAHLTVQCVGTCSEYLCKRAPLGKPVVPIYHQPAKDFTLPEEAKERPIIMIGPGTGVAPFRGFMQERRLTRSSAKNWLFFGERRSALDFYYEEGWRKLVSEGFLRLDTAFSRDGSEKFYVQHRMLERSRDLWEWIEEGAFLFVCGDAKRMAKDVDATLHAIAEKEGEMSREEARAFIKQLRHSRRYLRDVY